MKYFKNEDDLLIYKKQEDKEPYKVCPKCKTDKYLMDLQE